jgi:hypothetical protein
MKLFSVPVSVPLRFSFVVLFLAVAVVSSLKAEDSGDIPDSAWPAETGMYKTGKGAELAQALCMNCHSVEYVSTQPPMPRKFWEATVKKMKDKYFAPLPDDMTALVDYLSAAYGAK